MFAAFLKHLFPRVVLARNLKITYTFCLGGMAFTIFLLLIVTGSLLLFYYTPSPDNAYQSVLFIEENVFGGKIIRNIHKMCSHFLLVLIFLHTLRVLLTGAFKFRKYNWIIGMFLLVLVLFEGYIGYLLPMDQLAYWATQTGMELFKIFPFGDFIVEEILVPDGVGGPLTLSRFYAFHVVVVPLTLMVLCIIHFYKIRKDKGVLPYL